MVGIYCLSLFFKVSFKIETKKSFSGHQCNLPQNPYHKAPRRPLLCLFALKSIRFAHYRLSKNTVMGLSPLLENSGNPSTAGVITFPSPISSNQTKQQALCGSTTPVHPIVNGT